MSLIAGYQSRNGKVRQAEIETNLQAYRILVDDDLSNYDNLVIETRFGYLLRKYKQDYPVQRKPYNSGTGNALLVLGFLNSEPGWLSVEQLEKTEGEFVAVLSEASGTVHIINDRFGSRPFYILENQDGIYFSSNLPFLLQLVGRSHESDILGWFHMFSHGHTLGSRTTFKDVKRLLPASHVVISPGGRLEKRQYWRLEYQPARGLDPVSHGRAVFEAFKEGATVRSRLVGKGIIALSGGLDSRLVAAALPEDVAFSAFTFINSGEGISTADTEVAAQLCSVLGLPHRVESIQTDDFSNVAENVIRLTGGMRPLHHLAIVFQYIREMKRCGVKFLLGGGPGDVSAGSKIPSVQYLDPGRTGECVREFCRNLASEHEYLGLVFRQEIVEEYQREVYRSLIASFCDIGGSTGAHKITAWELLNRWPAFTFTSVLHNHPEMTEAFSHLDYKYADLMLKLPEDWLYQRNFYSFMIYNSLPNLRHIPYANTGSPLSGELEHFHYGRGLKGRAISFAAHATRKATPPKIKRLLKPIPRGTPGFNYYLYRSDDRLLAKVKENACSLKGLSEILDVDKCLRLVDNFATDKLPQLSYDSQTELIGSLATMCLTFEFLTNQAC